MRIEVTTWYLEMLDQRQLRPALSDSSNLVVMQAEVPSPEFSRFLYTSVGGDWYWLERLDWTKSRWLYYLKTPRDQDLGRLCLRHTRWLHRVGITARIATWRLPTSASCRNSRGNGLGRTC